MKTRMLATLIGLAILASVFAGCGSEKDSNLIKILKILPDEVNSVVCLDIEAMAEDPDLEATYNRVGNRVMTDAEEMAGIDASFCVYWAEAVAERGYLDIFVGDFDIETVRDALTNDDYERDEYNGTEIWTKGDLSIIFLKQMLVIGLTETVQGSIRVNNNEETSWYEDKDVKSVADKLPSGVMSMVLDAEYWYDILSTPAGGFCLQNPTSDDVILSIVGWFKYESEAKAEAGLEDIESTFEYYIELTGEFEVAQLNSELKGQFIEITGEVEITYASLIDDLRNEGATVESNGLVNQPFFSVQGRIITVNGSDVQVFQYPNKDTADSDANRVSDDGFQVGSAMMGWIASPHFFKDGKVIVIYVGDDVEVISILTEVLGTQFAGQ